MSDPDMELWRRAWSSAGETQAPSKGIDVILIVRRYRVRSTLKLAVNVALSILLIGGSLFVARRMHSREIVLWAIVVWMATLVALFLSLEGWRKERITPAATVADYVAFHRKKALADKWNARTAGMLLLVLFSISCVWFTADYVAHRIEYTQYMRIMALAVLFCTIWSFALLGMWKKAKAVLHNMPAGEQEADCPNFDEL